jgi:hypothetical protein
MILWISKKVPRPKPYQPRDVIAIDINEKKIAYGDDKINRDIDTAIDRAYRWKVLAKNFQRDTQHLDTQPGGGEKQY